MPMFCFLSIINFWTSRNVKFVPFILISTFNRIFLKNKFQIFGAFSRTRVEIIIRPFIKNSVKTSCHTAVGVTGQELAHEILA